jgi:hypothetical protein
MPDLDQLPEFPDFTPLEREHKDLLDSACAAARPDISEATFAYQWIWHPRTRCRLSRLGGSLLIMLDSASGQGTFLLSPITADCAEAAEAATSALNGGVAAEVVARVPEPVVNLLRGDPALSIAEQRDRADYVHVAEELRELPGPRFHAKRNHIRRFWAACPEARYLQMDRRLAELCIGFCRDWLATHPKRDVPGLQREVEATLAMLTDREWLGLRGGVLAAQERVLAFALGEPLNGGTFVVRVEKADTSVPGAYQAINQEFARHAAAGFEWINREQDLGMAGLRRAKQSYYPHHLVRKYEIRAAR